MYVDENAWCLMLRMETFGSTYKLQNSHVVLSLSHDKVLTWDFVSDSLLVPTPNTGRLSQFIF